MCHFDSIFMIRTHLGGVLRFARVGGECLYRGVDEGAGLDARLERLLQLLRPEVGRHRVKLKAPVEESRFIYIRLRNTGFSETLKYFFNKKVSISQVFKCLTPLRFRICDIL